MVGFIRKGGFLFFCILAGLPVGAGADFVASTGAGTPQIVRGISFDRPSAFLLSGSQPPYPAGFQGGVRVGQGDFNNDGIPDVVTAAGPGGGPHIKLFDGASGVIISQFFAYDLGFTGGVHVAVGDLTGDGILDIVTGAGEGGGPHVKVFATQVVGPAVMRHTVAGEFFAFSANFTGGVRVAVGKIDDSPGLEIIAAAGPGGGPHVRIFTIRGEQIRAPEGSFFAYNSDFRGGVFVAAGDLNGDGKDEIVTGPGAGGGPHVKIFEPLNGGFAERNAFFAYDLGYSGGVPVAVGHITGDSRAEIITGSGAGDKPTVGLFGPNGERIKYIRPFHGLPGGEATSARTEGVWVSASAGAFRTLSGAQPLPAVDPVRNPGTPNPWGNHPPQPPSTPPQTPASGGQCTFCRICERQIFPRPALCYQSIWLNECIESSSAYSQAIGTTVTWPGNCTPPPIPCSGCVMCTDQYPGEPQRRCYSYLTLNQCSQYSRQGFQVSYYLPVGCR